MSVEAMAIVLHHSQQTGTRKLLLVGIANHDGDGGAWPTIETLAKYANTDERNVRRRLTEIVADGELAIHYNAGGSLKTPLHERPNLYEILVACPPNCDGSRNHRLLPLAVVPGGEGSTTSPPADVPDPEGGEGRTTPGGEGRTTPGVEGSTTPPGGGRTTPQTVLEPSLNRPSNRPAP